MKKRNFYVVLAAIVIVCVSVVFYLAMQEKSWDTQINNYKKESIIEDSEKIRVSFFYPSFPSNKVNTIIKTYVDNSISQFKTEIDETHSENEKAYELNCDFELFHNADYVSLKFDYTRIYPDADKITQSVETLVFDYGKKKEISVDDLFKTESQDLNKLASVIVNKVDKENPQLIDNVAAVETITGQKNVIENFTIKELGVSFYFGATELEPNQSEPVEVMLSFAELKDLLELPVEEYIEDALASAKPSEEPEKLPSKPVSGTVKKVKGKVVAFTFDDGPGGKNTEYLLKKLKKMKVKATFMLLGTKVNAYPKQVAQMVADGHEIGNHSYSHLSLNKLSKKKIKKQISRTDKAIEKATNGHTSTLLRPPYGAYNEKVLKLAEKPVIMWNVDTLDWKYRNAKKLEKSLVKNTRKGDIVLMHDIHKPTVKGVVRAIKRLKKKGFKFVTVSEMLGKMKIGKVYFKR